MTFLVIVLNMPPKLTINHLTTRILPRSIKKCKLEKVAIANALQLEAARATPALSRFNYYAMSSLKVAEPIHCRIIAFLLLIHYFTLWP